MRYIKKITVTTFCLTILVILFGCDSMQRIGAPSEITLNIEPIKCNPQKMHHTVHIDINEFVDKRPDTKKDIIGIYNMPLWSDVCKLRGFENIVTNTFRHSIKNAQVEIPQSEIGKLILSGEIQEFLIYWKTHSGYPAGNTVGYNPLVIQLTLMDEQEQTVWQKKIKGEIEGSLYLHGLFSMTAGDHMKSAVKKCILNAVKKLLSDDSFWNASRPVR